MPISAEKHERVRAALAALQSVRDEYKDVLVVLDYVTLGDVANHEVDSDNDPPNAGAVLSEEELEGVLWRVGKHANSADTSYTLLPAAIQYALDEHERKETH